MLVFARRIASVLPVVVCIGSHSAPAQTGDEKIAELHRPPTVEAKYLAAHPGATSLAPVDGALAFRNANGSRAKVLGAVTHRDPKTRDWVMNAPVLSTTANGRRIDGTRFDVLMRKSGAGHSVTQSFTDYDNRHTSTLTVNLPQLTYGKQMAFALAKDGTPWTLRFDATGAFDLTSVVAAKQGKEDLHLPGQQLGAPCRGQRR